MLGGRDIIASGYCLYGGSTQMVYSTLDMFGIQMDTLVFGEWKTNFTNYTMPLQGKIYAINESNKRRWVSRKWELLIGDFLDRGYTTRWVGSLVADTHRTLLKGGFFAYPENNKYIM